LVGWIRIRIHEGKKTHKNGRKGFQVSEVLDVLFRGLTASPAASMSFKEPGIKSCNFLHKKMDFSAVKFAILWVIKTLDPHPHCPNYSNVLDPDTH
jgi:hypothetical protein